MSLVDTYRALFGKRAPKDGDVISMAEHGRAGGISTGQGFKFISIVGEATQVAEDGEDSNVTYVGKAIIGSPTSTQVWQVKKIDSTTGTVITWADSNDNYDNEWDERENLTYG